MLTTLIVDIYQALLSLHISGGSLLRVAAGSLLRVLADVGTSGSQERAVRQGSPGRDRRCRQDRARRYQDQGLPQLEHLLDDCEGFLVDHEGLGVEQIVDVDELRGRGGDTGQVAGALDNDVKVAKVNTLNVSGKAKRLGAGRLGKTRSWKKAYVQLAEDSKTIELFEGMV